MTLYPVQLFSPEGPHYGMRLCQRRDAASLRDAGCGAQAGVLSIHLQTDSLLCMIRGVARTVLVRSTK